MKNWNKIKVKTLAHPKPKNVDGMKKGSDKNETNFNFWDWLIIRVKEFCSVTALHGYAHIVREDTALWERIIWVVIALGALIVAIILLWFSWTWNAETPTVTVIESTHYATWNIPFPAITVCLSNKISAAAALIRARSMRKPANITDEQLSAKFRLLLHFEGLGEADDAEYLELHNILEMNKIKVDELMRDISPNCMDLLLRCMWKGTQTRCDTLFQVIKTVEGLCCSFNYYGLEKHSYSQKWASSIPTGPRRVTSCGFQTGLSVLIKPNLFDYHSTVMSTFGFRVMIHSSYDFPDDNAETKLVPPSIEAFISLSPESTYSTSDVYRLPVDLRNCLSENEFKLGVMQKYSYVNCLAECRSNIVFDKCGCVPYNFPNNGTRPTCALNKLQCVNENREWFQGSLPGVNKTVVDLETIEKSPCGCYPDCAMVQYPSEISSGHLNREYSFNSLGFFKDIELSDETLVHVFFKELVATHYRNDMYQNWLGVLATFGGLLGLFLGFSLVTGFEMIYFFTLRVLFDRIAPKKVAPSY